MIFGEQCAGGSPSWDLYTEWELCCPKDEDVDDGTCKFCSSCGSLHPYNMDRRMTKIGKWGGFDILGGNCQGYI
jgi:hypothetical protein